MFEEKDDYSLIFGLKKININEIYNQILNSNPIEYCSDYNNELYIYNPIEYYDNCNNELYIYNLINNNKINLTDQKEILNQNIDLIDLYSNTFYDMRFGDITMPCRNKYNDSNYKILYSYSNNKQILTGINICTTCGFPLACHYQFIEKQQILNSEHNDIFTTFIDIFADNFTDINILHKDYPEYKFIEIIEDENEIKNKIEC